MNDDDLSVAPSVMNAIAEGPAAPSPSTAASIYATSAPTSTGSWWPWVLAAVVLYLVFRK